MAGVRGLFIPGPTNVPDRVRRAFERTLHVTPSDYRRRFTRA